MGRVPRWGFPVVVGGLSLALIGGLAAAEYGELAACNGARVFDGPLYPKAVGEGSWQQAATGIAPCQECAASEIENLFEAAALRAVGHLRKFRKRAVEDDDAGLVELAGPRVSNIAEMGWNAYLGTKEDLFEQLLANPRLLEACFNDSDNAVQITLVIGKLVLVTEGDSREQDDPVVSETEEQAVLDDPAVATEVPIQLPTPRKRDF